MMNKKPLSQIITDTETCFPSIFSKEDVLLILNSIDEEQGISEEKIKELKDELINAFDRMRTDDIIDMDSAEFEIQNGNEIILEDVSLNNGNIEDTINETIDGFFMKNDE